MILNRYTFTVFSNVLVYCIMWGVLHITGNDADAQIGPGDSPKFQKVVLIGISIGLVTSLIFHVFLKEGANGNGDVNGNRTQYFDFFSFYLSPYSSLYIPTAVKTLQQFSTIFRCPS